MVKILRRGKDVFLKAEDVYDGDVLTIVEPPYVQSAEKSKFGKDRTVVAVSVPRKKGVFRWGLNNTSSDRLLDAFGEEGDLWKGKEVRVKKRNMLVRGEEKAVLFAVPSTQVEVETEVSTAQKTMVEPVMSTGEFQRHLKKLGINIEAFNKLTKEEQSRLIKKLSMQ